MWLTVLHRSVSCHDRVTDVAKHNGKFYRSWAWCSLYLHALQKASESLEPGKTLCILLSVHHLRLHFQFRNNCTGPPTMAQHQVLHICQLILQRIQFFSMLDISGTATNLTRQWTTTIRCRRNTGRVTPKTIHTCGSKYKWERLTAKSL